MNKFSQIKNSLYAKIALAFLVVITLLGALLLYLSESATERYSQEIMQRLNKSVAMYVAGQQAIITDAQVNESVVDELASRAMILNPSLEIYILDQQGSLLSHRLPADTITTNRVDMQPIRDYLSGDVAMPIYGNDPRDRLQKKVFSVAPITEGDDIQGYVYAVIGGQMYQDLRTSILESHSLKTSLGLILFAIFIAAVIGCILFFVLTRRLSLLRNEISQFGRAKLSATTASYLPNQLISQPKNEAAGKGESHDEIAELENTFHQMSSLIDQQFEAIQSIDETRRELIANVSHDLRTPLASMQGYIETLLLKDGSLSSEERKHYLEIAHKHSRRLSRLVSELFELAKLEAKGIEPKMEPFSLLELVHDSVQEFGLQAESKKIELEISAEEDCYVDADIALIQRVLQNLIDNALRHTPAGGKVEIRVRRNENSASVEVSDTGKGIQTHEIPHIFDRFYQSKQQEPSEKIGTGLGLAIVKRILDLHHSAIAVKSQVDKGTSFVFELPQHA